MCCGDKKLKKKSNLKSTNLAIRENGKILMRYLGNDSVADWRVPGKNRTYRVSKAKPLFYAQPDEAEPLSKFVYKGKPLFEIVPIEPNSEPKAPEPAPPEVATPPEPEIATPEPVSPEEELPFTDPDEPDTTDESDEADDEDTDLVDDSLWGSDSAPKKTRRRTSK